MEPQEGFLTGMTVGFDHRANTSQWEFLEKVHKSLVNTLHLNRKLTCKQGATLCWMPPPHTHCSPKHNVGQTATPHFSEFPIRSSASVRGLNEHRWASYLGTLLALLGPQMWRQLCPPRGPRSPPWAGFSRRNEEQGDLQQAQGAQPLEGQRRDALEGIVAEDAVGGEGG